MFGVDFVGHPNLIHIYLPGDFEGHPMRKDFPLLARRVKPWPGIVDVEPMPGGDDEDADEGSPADAAGGRAHDGHLRSRPAGGPGRPGRRQPHQRRLRVRGHDPQHRPAAPGHPRHPAHRGQARRRAGGVGRAHRRLHAPRLREADRGPHLSAGDDAHQPHRLAGQLRQRGALHPGRREADGDRGPAPRPAHPHDPLRAQPHRQHLAVPRRPGHPARRPVGRLLRLPRPRVRAQPDRGGHRRTLPPQLRPYRRPQGRPAQGLDRRDRTWPWRSCAAFCDEVDDILIGNEIFQKRTRGRRRSSRPRSPSPTGCAGPTPGAAASTGTCAATSARPAWSTTRPTGRSGPIPTATPSPARGSACRRPARPPRSSTSSSTAIPSGPIMAKVPRIIKVPEGEAWVATENPLGEMGYYVVSKGDLVPVPGEDPLGFVQQRLDRALGVPRRLRSRRHHHPCQPLLHPR